MAALREIFVKAVCARGRETFQRTHRFRAKYHPDDILGCRVNNATCRASYDDGAVTVNGSYDIHVWYAYTAGGDAETANNRSSTAIAVQTVDFAVDVPVEALVDDLDALQNPEVRVRCVRPPKVRDCAIDADGVIHVTVSDGYGVQVVGETNLWVPVYAGVSSDDVLKKGDDELWEAFQDAEDDFDDTFMDSDGDDIELDPDFDDEPEQQEHPARSL